MAILIGLGVANVFSPGTGAAVTHPKGPTSLGGDIAGQLLENIPDSLVKPLVENRVIGVVIIAVAFGLAARRLTGSRRRTAEDLVSLGFDCILVILSWVIALVPLAVFGKVASIVGVHGFAPFAALGHFVLAVLVASFFRLVTTWFASGSVPGCAPSPCFARRATRW